MSGSSIKAGEAYVKVTAKDQASGALKRLQARLGAVGASFAKVGAGVTAVGATVMGPLLAAVKTTVSMGDAMDKMSLRTGASVEALSELKHAAGLSGSNIGELESGLVKMQKLLGDAAEGSTGASDTLAKLGTSVAELQALSPDKQFELFAEKISKIEDPALKTTAAADVFGRTVGQKLIPLMSGGAKGIDDMRKSARALGLTMATEDAKAAAAFGDQLDTLWSVVKMGVFNVGAALIPALAELAGVVVNVSVAIGKWIKENRDVFLTIAKVAAGVMAAGAALVAIGAVFSTVAASIGGIISVASAAGAVLAGIGSVLAFVISPVGLLIVGLTAAAGAFLYFSGVGGKVIEFLREKFAALSEITTTAFQGISDALKAGDLGLAAQIAWAGVRVAFRAGTDEAMGIVDDFIHGAMDTFVWFRARVGEVVVSIVKFFADNFGSLMDTLMGWSISAAEIFAGFKEIVFGTDISQEIANLQKLKGMSATQIAELAGKGVAAQEGQGFTANQLSREQKERNRQAASDAARRELAQLVQQAARDAAGVTKDEPNTAPSSGTVSANPSDAPGISAGELERLRLERLKRDAEKSAGALPGKEIEAVGTFSSEAAGLGGLGASSLNAIKENTKKTQQAAEKTARFLLAHQWGIPVRNS